MDSTCLPDWNTDSGVEFPLPIPRKSLGLENEVVELLWQNGEVVLHSQNHHRKQTYDHPSKHKQLKPLENPNNPSIHDNETVCWVDCPIDETFEKDFCSNFLSENIPVEPDKKDSKSGASEANHVSRGQDFVTPPPPRFEITGKTCNNISQGECSARTMLSSHCASNQVVNEETRAWRSVGPLGESVERTAGPTRQAVTTSSSGGSGRSSSSLWKTSSQSNKTKRHKRKSRDVAESQCRSDATELESAAGNKSSQKTGTTRRSRVAEVHNLSERRRRDRINEKMRALQELIPHSNKSDKASMLDEAIEYVKSLQSQLQLMWMGSGMASMMLPGMQHYMSRVGMGIGPPMLPAFQNLMHLSRLPLVDQAMNIASMPNQAPIGHRTMLSPVNYQNQMQSSSFQDQYANYMGFQPMQNTSQPINVFNFGSHSAQQNHVLAPPGNANGPVG